MKTPAIKVFYFTDPVCSTCWLIEPYIDKLLLEYGFMLEMDCKMGGLMPAWNQFRRIDRNLPNDVYLSRLWNQQSLELGVVMNGNIWLEDPIQSSYPASIAYYAAKRQGQAFGFAMLRTLREMLFLQNKNIGEERHLITAAIHCNLNLPQFLDDYSNGLALADFNHDIAEKNNWKIEYFPTLVFVNQDGRVGIGKIPTLEVGFDELYADWEQIINALSPGMPEKKTAHLDVLALIKTHKKNTVRELEIISGYPRPVIKAALLKAYEVGTVICEKHHQADYWMSNDTPYRIQKNNFSVKRAAIIGAGVCGTYLAAMLKQGGLIPTVYERKKAKSSKGLGFLLLENGVEAMKVLGYNNKVLTVGNSINFFKSVRPDGSLIYSKPLENCIAFTREAFMGIFEDEIGEEHVVFDKNVLEVVSDESNKIQSITFEDGSEAISDIYFAVDGIASNIRTQLFKHHPYEKTHEHELVCFVEIPDLDVRQDEFVKVVDGEQGKYIGLIPLGKGKYIWFLQFNGHKHPLPDTQPATIARFVSETVAMYPPVFQRIVAASDFNDAFLWKSHRMDLLPSFHHDNMVLAGDAAHPLLALTSQGANSALEDAAILVSLLSQQTPEQTLEDVFTQYYNSRKETIQYYIEEGDVLLQEFLNTAPKCTIRLPLAIAKKAIA
jgi:2-polyprenyl-6-methoxyphenol hydroxylase-like FAD-dependent oxidoreductase/predicted DsbA family dithiol-disulfide isomerase